MCYKFDMHFKFAFFLGTHIVMIIAPKPHETFVP